LRSLPDVTSVGFDQQRIELARNQSEFFTLTDMLLAVLAGACLSSAQAAVILDEPIRGGVMIVDVDGEVVATYLGTDAGYFSYLYVTNSSMPIFDKNTARGTTTTVGSFAAGGDKDYSDFVFLLSRVDRRHAVPVGGQTYCGTPSTTKWRKVAYLSPISRAAL